MAVPWTDAADDRRGWVGVYAAAGARIRNLPASLKEAVERDLGHAWIAYTDLPSYHPADEDTQRVLAMLTKILQRGRLTPIDPRAEALLIQAEGLGVEPPTPGSLCPTLTNALDGDDLRKYLGYVDDRALDTDLPFDSPAEQVVYLALAGSSVTARRLSMQAPLDVLATGSGVPSNGARRLDFMVTGQHSIRVVEVDGPQHEGDGADQDRDVLIERIGGTTKRIPTSSVAAGTFTKDLPPLQHSSEHWHALVHGPIQIQRFQIALIEALRRGFLAGDRWTIKLEDPTGLATVGFEYALELLAAVDALWGNCLAPKAVQVQAGNRIRHWHQDGNTYIETNDADRAPCDLEVHLDLGLSPWHALPDCEGRPAVVVRDCVLPVRVRIGQAEPAARITPQVDSERIESALTTVLRSVFALSDFRAGQLRAIREVVSGRDCVVLLPTGAGKSLIYQVAGLILPGRTLIVDPLVSLIEDQQRSLEAMGIDRVVALSGYVTQSGGKNAALLQVQSGDALFAFISPERLLDPDFRSRLKILTSSTPINLAVIDEAHCVSEWGHDFRVAYLNVGPTLRRFGADQRGVPPPILALTGTASRAVLKDVLNDLGIEQRTADTIIKPASFDRPELNIEVIVDRPQNHEARLIGAIQAMPGFFQENAARFFTRSRRPFAGIVFVPHANGRYGVGTVAALLSQQIGADVVQYSGTAPKGFERDGWEAEKRRAAASFMRDDTPLLVSTKAFGMGIDKPNVRYVIHYGAPGSIESYYQEIGRAGRDGRQARCVLIVAESDRARTTSLLDDATALMDLHEHVASRSKGIADDCVDRNLFFYTNSFPGIASEVLAVKTTLDFLEPLDESHAVKLGFGASEGETEQAIHRLGLLGIVEDYTKSYGSKRFDVYVRASTPDDVARHLTAFIERSQPGRSAGLAERIRTGSRGKTRDAVETAVQTLTEFIYDTVAAARRRSLREVILAAREGHRDPSEFRRRILDYLQEGDIAPIVERLVDSAELQLHQWVEAVEAIDSIGDAQEWRGSTARLLASYPNQPGLLLARGFSELLIPDGDAPEGYRNITAAVSSAQRNYAAQSEPIFQAIHALALNRIAAGRADQALGMALETRSEFSHDQQQILMAAIRIAEPDMPALAVLDLDGHLESLIRICDEQLTREFTR